MRKPHLQRGEDVNLSAHWIARRSARRPTGTVLVLATSHDGDQYVVALPHRGVTHTVWAALAVGGAVELGTPAGETVSV